MYQGRRFKVVTPPTGYQTPPNPAQHSFQQIVGSYFSSSVWKWVGQYSIQHHYWMRAAAIAYGIAFCILLSFLALLAGASLSADVKTAIIATLTQWDLINPEVIGNLITQTATEWKASHRWVLLVTTSVIGMSLWLKIVGMAQQILRITSTRDAFATISIRQRLSTTLLALVSALLLLLAHGFVFVTLPNGFSEAIADATVWNTGKRLIIQGLRWSLAFSTVSLMFGLFYRASLQFSARTQPLLPGALMATILWSALSILFKTHLSTVSNHHWLYGAFSTITLLMLGLYLNAMGLLVGGCFNTVLSHYLPKLRSRTQYLGTPPPPPSFESFTIQRRIDRHL